MRGWKANLSALHKKYWYMEARLLVRYDDGFMRLEAPYETDGWSTLASAAFIRKVAVSSDVLQSKSNVMKTLKQML